VSVPRLSPLEYVLGRLWLGPADPRALLYPPDCVPGTLDDARLMAVLNGLLVQGLVVCRGRCVLVRGRLHARARRIAELAARDIMVLRERGCPVP